MIGAEDEEKAVGLLLKLFLYSVLHVIRVVRRQFVDDKLLRQLDLLTELTITTKFSSLTV